MKKAIITNTSKETKTVALNMASGDQVINGNYAKVTIEKPSTLKAENIKSGVNIGGVIGTKKVYTPEETSVNLNLANGNHIVKSSTDKLFKQVKVTKPYHLGKNAIKQGVNIMGVVGTYTPTIATEEITKEPSGNGNVIATASDGAFISKLTVKKITHRTEDTKLADVEFKDVIRSGFTIAGSSSSSEDIGVSGANVPLTLNASAFSTKDEVITYLKSRAGEYFYLPRNVGDLEGSCIYRYVSSSGAVQKWSYYGIIDNGL